jgi:hypothetical protein
MRVLIGGWVVVRQFRRLFVRREDNPVEEREAIISFDERKLIISSEISNTDAVEVGFRAGWVAREKAMIPVMVRTVD